RRGRAQRARPARRPPAGNPPMRPHSVAHGGERRERVERGTGAPVSEAAELDADAVREGLRRLAYFTTPRVETALFLALRLGKPLLAEGPPGAGKTELA